jgi:hypothetical protein
MYWFRTGNALDGIAIIPFFFLFTFGGWLLSTHAFKLKSRERVVVGFGLGLALTLWFSNLFGRWLSPQIAFWGAAGAVLLLGLLSTIWSDRPFLDKKDLQVWPLLLFFMGITLLFTLMGRGLGIFDDRKNLSIISTMAAGDIPPHFYMNSGFLFKYHYGFQLFGASLMRVGGLFPWSAFDLSKGITAALAIALAYLWGWRVTYRKLGGVITAFVLTFASGGRWLLTLLPPSILSRAGAQLTLWGSGSSSAPDLFEGLTSTWVIVNGPPVQIPFAFVNGILQPFILYLQAGPKSLALVIFLLLFLLFRRQMDKFGLIILTLLLAMWGLTAEAEFVLFAIGLFTAFIVLRAWRVEPNWRLELRTVTIVLVIASAIIIFQGGTITETVRGVMLPTEEPLAGTAGPSVGFSLRFPPAIVSAHLGELRITKPGELLIGLMEIGPALLLFPFVLWSSIRWAKRGRFLYLAIAISTFFGFVIPLFLRYEVDRDITRLTNYALLGWILLSIPLLRVVWRQRLSDWGRTIIVAGAALLVFGGLIVTGSLLTAIPKAVLGYAIEPVDAAMTRLVWDKLEPGADVLDSRSWRAVPITGRLTRSAVDSYAELRAWSDLVDFPEVHKVSASGYQYVYIDTFWWDSIPEIARDSYSDSCVNLIHETHDNASNGSRWLFDVNECAPETSHPAE